MRTLRTMILLTALCCGWRSPAAPEETSAAGADGVRLGWHFAGAEALKRDTNCAKLYQMGSWPESEAFRDMALECLGRALPDWLQLKSSLTPQARLAFLKPLLEQLSRNESRLEIRGKNGQPAEILLAVETTEAQASLWSTNLWQWLAAEPTGSPAPLQVEGYSGWVVRKFQPVGSFRFVRAGGWSVVALGQEALPGLEVWLRGIKKEGRPTALKTNCWLEATVDLPWLATAVPWPYLAHYALPVLKLSCRNKADNVLTHGTLTYPQSLNWRSESWRVPTNTIHDPLVSFTALNGAGKWLAKDKTVAKLNLKAVPNQVFLWAQGGIPFLCFGGVPVQDMTNLVNHLALQLPPLLISDDPVRAAGSIIWNSNRAELVWRGLPIMTPYLRAVREPVGEFLVGGLFPQGAEKKKAAPQELFAQILSRTNLVYYDWEITQERLGHWLQIYEFLPLFTPVAQVPIDRPGQKWLATTAAKLGNTFTPKLGNTITELQATSSRELTLMRKSPLGLTGYELVALARWLDVVHEPVPSLLPARRSDRKPPGPAPAPKP